ncbi:MAG: formate dehydrogenase subunit gamma, partial [Burkholderiales bacterium]
MRLRALFATCWLAICACLGGAVAADPAAEQAKRQAEQPLNNAPVWREVRSGESHTTQVRGRETGVLIQSGGETWRQIRNGPVT